MKHLQAVLASVLPPLVVFVLLLLVWQTATYVTGIESYLLPSPWQVTQAAWGARRQLAGALGLTASGAVLGFCISLVVGTLVAILFSFSRFIRTSCYPYAIFLQTVPIVAIAPLIVVWFGYGFHSVVLVAFIISLFPMITNATTGLTAIDRDLLDLFELHNASRRQTLFKLRLPSAVPYLVSGAKISSGLAVVGAIVGEFFTGFGSTRFGLGYMIMQSTTLLKTDLLFAAVLVSTALGVVVFTSVNALGATILSRWHQSTS